MLHHCPEWRKYYLDQQELRQGRLEKIFSFHFKHHLRTLRGWAAHGMDLWRQEQLYAIPASYVAFQNILLLLMDFIVCLVKDCNKIFKFWDLLHFQQLLSGSSAKLRISRGSPLQPLCDSPLWCSAMHLASQLVEQKSLNTPPPHGYRAVIAIYLAWFIIIE